MAVKIKDVIASSLFLRDSADRFFDTLESEKSKSIIVDFEGVETISRSFAHQYVSRKKQSSKQVREVNVPRNVKEMLRIVQAPARKLPFVVERPLKIHTLVARPNF